MSISTSTIRCSDVQLRPDASNAVESSPGSQDIGSVARLQTHFVTLDLMRGVAACIVAVGHYTGQLSAHLAVDFFLVLSGFILASRYLYGAPVSFGQFLVARLARLYPLHLATLLLFAALCLLRFRSLPDYADGTAETFVGHLLLMQNVGLHTSELTWNAPSWSISVELWVNLAFFFLVSRRTPTWALLVTSCVGFALLAAQAGTLATSLPNIFGLVNLGLVRGASSFLLGIVAYRTYLRLVPYRDHRIVQGWSLRLPALAAALALMLVSRPDHRDLDFAAPWIFFLCIVLFAFDSPRWANLMHRCSYLGIISYSIYLMHYPIYFALRYLREFAAGTAADAMWVTVLHDTTGGFLLYAGLVLGVSHLTYRYFELPSRTTVRKLMGAQA